MISTVLHNSSTEEVELVEVDQRGLVDKILARYSSKFAVLRELLQNADDAESKNVLIRFESFSKSYNGLDLNSKIVQLSVQNNGKVFSDADWERLRVIANGNPDVDKVGTFGVGFYSVFSITDNPLIQSGTDCRMFSWNDHNRLHIIRSSRKRLENPWVTTIELPVRVNDQLPGEFPEIRRFLATSLLFMNHITSVSLFFDSLSLFSLERIGTPSENIHLADQLRTTIFPELETVMECIDKRVIRIRLQGSAYQGLPSEPSSLAQDIKVWSASVKIQPKDKVRAALMKTTKKSAIREISYIQITFNAHSVQGDSQKANSLYELKGHIYIGHATTQTTGFAGHISAPFIPTVERELLDLENASVKNWNENLLHSGGHLARMIYDHEMNSIATSWSKSSYNQLRAHALYLLRFFTFEESNPHPRVSIIVHDAFTSAGEFPFLTSKGIFPAKQVRAYNTTCQKFIKTMPMLDEEMSAEARKMLGERATIVLKPVSFHDVIAEIDQRPLNKEEMVACLDWLIARDHQTTHSEDERLIFLNSARIEISEGTLISLGTITNVLDLTSTPFITPSLPFPHTTLPYNISSFVQDFPGLMKLFKGRVLSVREWLLNICHLTRQNPKSAADTFIKMFNGLYSYWPGLSNEVKGVIRDILRDVPCVPTCHGVQLLHNSYLSDTIASAFPELSTVIDLVNTKQMHDMLLWLGVKDRIDVELLDSHIEKWHNLKLLQYLIAHELTEDEISSLRCKQIFTGRLNENRKYRADELYVPSRELGDLGLPTLAWDNEQEWSDHSQEAKLLFDLGLYKLPELLALLEIASKPSFHKIALKFLLTNFHNHYEKTYLKLDDSQKEVYASLKFIPAEYDGAPSLAVVSEVYIESDCAILGFQHVSRAFQTYATQFGVAAHPPASKLISGLKNLPPKDNKTAQACFNYLLLRAIPDLTELSTHKFVPVRDSSGGYDLFAPSECFTGLPDPSHYAKVFTFVDFGRDGNLFLEQCGAKSSPTLSEVASKLLHDPMFYYRALDEDQHLYFQELRKISELSRTQLEELQLKRPDQPILIGCPYSSYNRSFDARPPPRSKQTPTEREEKPMFAPGLLQPHQVVIMDDELNYSMFNNVPDLYHAPKVLEDLYRTFGSQLFSEIITETYAPYGRDSAQTTFRHLEIRDIILKRLPLFFGRQQDTIRAQMLEEMRDIKTFYVRVFDGIHVTKVLHFDSKLQTHKRTTTAGYHIMENPFTFELWLTDKYDFFDIAYCVLKRFYVTPSSNMCAILMSLLQATTAELRQRGYPIEDEETFIEGYEKQDQNINMTLATPPQSINFDFTESFVRSFWNNLGLSRRSSGFNLSASDAIDDMITSAVQSTPGSIQAKTRKEKPKRYCCRGSYQGNLECADTSAKYEVWVRTKSNAKEILKTKRDMISKFIDEIIEPLREVYCFDVGRVRIFCDPACKLSAFNDHLHIYLNLEQFEEERKKGRASNLIAWHFILAHEFAHYSFPDHDANFEQFCSAICQKFLLRLINLPRAQGFFVKAV